MNNNLDYTFILEIKKISYVPNLIYIVNIYNIEYNKNIILIDVFNTLNV